MLSGFNTNFRHRGVLFHVQTEDSGRDNPHVITHLFHGGNIMASVKRDYGKRLGVADVEDVVRGLMEGQHKEMLKQLSRGEHDEAIGQRLGEGIFDESQAAHNEDTEREAMSEAPPDRPEAEGPQAARQFGGDIASQKPLDEVVLDYLVENARKRKRASK
jgi:hypothetical protein